MIELGFWIAFWLFAIPIGCLLLLAMLCAIGNSLFGSSGSGGPPYDWAAHNAREVTKLLAEDDKRLARLRRYARLRLPLRLGPRYGPYPHDLYVASLEQLRRGGWSGVPPLTESEKFAAALESCGYNWAEAEKRCAATGMADLKAVVQ